MQALPHTATCIHGHCSAFLCMRNARQGTGTCRPCSEAKLSRDTSHGIPQRQRIKGSAHAQSGRIVQLYADSVSALWVTVFCLIALTSEISGSGWAHGDG